MILKINLKRQDLGCLVFIWNKVNVVTEKGMGTKQFPELLSEVLKTFK